MAQGQDILVLAEVEEAWLLANRELGKLWNAIAETEEEQHWGDMPDFSDEEKEEKSVPPPSFMPPLSLPPPMDTVEPYDTDDAPVPEAAVDQARASEMVAGEAADRQFSTLIQRMTLAEDAGETKGDTALDTSAPADPRCSSAASMRARIQAALGRGDAVLPVAPRGFDPRPLERRLRELRQITRNAGGVLVYVRPGVPICFRDEAPLAEEPESAVAATVAPAPARPFYPMHWLQWTAMPGVMFGDKLIIDPEAHCVCQSVHRVSRVAVQWAIASSGHLCGQPFLREGDAVGAGEGPPSRS
jgi:hypothetical protein